MSTGIEIAYSRTFATADIQAIIARANATTNVLEQLGAAFQSLPGMVLVDYKTDSQSLQDDVSTCNSLIDQLREKLISIDAKAKPLDECNKAALKALTGLLNTNANRALLDQITGPTAQSNSSEPTPPTP